MLFRSPVTMLLEAQLIKRFRPPYNVLLRDDKSFPFILLRADHAFPRITKHRGARKAKGDYYGPFASAGSVNTTINALQKLFLLRSCTDSFMARRDRPCLLYQIKRCAAPCVNRIDEAGYGELVRQAKDFLGGKSSAVQRELEAQMAEAAEALDYERAAMLRQARSLCQGGALFIGVDLVKPKAVLEAAYDDALGVTAAFNLNLLRHSRPPRPQGIHLRAANIAVGEAVIDNPCLLKRLLIP